MTQWPKLTSDDLGWQLLKIFKGQLNSMVKILVTFRCLNCDHRFLLFLKSQLYSRKPFVRTLIQQKNILTKNYGLSWKRFNWKISSQQKLKNWIICYLNRVPIWGKSQGETRSSEVNLFLVSVKNSCCALEGLSLKITRSYWLMKLLRTLIQIQILSFKKL